MAEAKYRCCPSYALVIEVTDTDDPEDVLSTLELVVQLDNLINGHTNRTSFVDDSYSDALSDRLIEV